MLYFSLSVGLERQVELSAALEFGIWNLEFAARRGRDPPLELE